MHLFKNQQKALIKELIALFWHPDSHKEAKLEGVIETNVNRFF